MKPFNARYPAMLMHMHGFNSGTGINLRKGVTPVKNDSKIGLLSKNINSFSVPSCGRWPFHAKMIPDQKTGPEYTANGMMMFVRHFTRQMLDPDRLGSVNLLEIKRYLRQKGLDFSESHACLSVTVPKHILLSAHYSKWAVPPPSQWECLDVALTQVFINKTTGGFVCPELALSGDWKLFQDFLCTWHMNKCLKKGEPHKEYPVLNKLDLVLPDCANTLWKSCQPIESLSNKEFKDILKLFKLPVRELRIEDFVKHEVRVTEDLSQLVFPVLYVSGQMVGLRTVRICEESGKILEENLPSADFYHQKDKNRVHRIFPFPHGLHGLHGMHKSIVLTTSVLDTVCLMAKTNLFPVALAEGSTHLPPEQLPFFEGFEKISIWFPNEISACDSARMFAKKLGEKRCHMVGRDFDCPSATLRKRDQPSLNDVIKFKAKPCCHEHITTFESLREDVFLEMAHYEEIEGIKWKRFEGFNETLRGFRRGELTVFTGKTGTGKTTFMSEYSVDLCMQGVNTLWGSFEVKNIRLAKMQLKQFSAVNLEENLDLFDSWADRFQKLPMYYLTFHGAQEIEKVLDAMGHAVYIYDIAHVIIDNIQFMMGMTNKVMDKYYLQDIIIQKFRKFATLHNVHVTLVIHPRKEDDERLTTNSIFGGAKATQEADNVVILQEEEINLKLKRKFIQIAKNRFSGDLGLIPLFFNKGTLTFSKKVFQKEKSLKKKAEPSRLEEIASGVDERDRTTQGTTR